MFYLGIDVAKAKLDCCLLLDDKDKRKTKVVSNSKSGIVDLLAWLAKQNVCPPALHVAMEATSVYHEQAAQALVSAHVTVYVVNPAQVKDFGRGLAVRTKTDAVDSWVLARFCASSDVHKRPWTPPSPEARLLQALLLRREAVAQDLQRERNRLEKAQATDTPPRIHESIAAGIVFLTQELTKLQGEIDAFIDNNETFKDDFSLLQSIPGVGPQVGSNLLSVMHRHHFERAEQLAAFVGLVPTERQSGSSISGRPRLSKAGDSRTRAVLYMAAVCATRCNPHVRAVYLRLISRGKSKMSALGAAMRKLVHLCFGVIKTQLPYQADYVKTAKIA